MRASAILCLLLAITTPAWSGQSEAKSCAAQLDTNGKLIFDAALPKVSPDVNLKDVITATAKSLVMSSQIKRANAKDAATAAGHCLKIAMQ